MRFSTIADNLHERFVILVAKVLSAVERVHQVHVVVLQKVQHVLVGEVALLTGPSMPAWLGFDQLPPFGRCQLFYLLQKIY